MNRMHPQVDGYLRKAKKWQKELQALRGIVLDCSLNEEVKWRQPCYTLQGKNVVLIAEFKEYCALLFVKGALLKDAVRILAAPGENTQSGRLIRFTSVREIVEMGPTLKAYIHEAIEVEEAGLQVRKKRTADFKVAAEFKKKLDVLPALKASFETLTPGRQRGYLLYFSGAKQSKTRQSRVEKCVPRILKRKGLED